MRAMVLTAPGATLEERKVLRPEPGKGQVRIKVSACGVCRTDLHVRDGDLENAKLPLVLGHEIVGTVDALGADVSLHKPGDRVCVPWLGSTCNNCFYCLSNRENLCEHPLFTGYTVDGGFAEYTVADQNYVFKAPEGYSDVELAPLLCAGLIGWRSFKFADLKAGQNLGIYGFGAAAHIITQVALYKQIKVFAFTRPGDLAAREFALGLGAAFAGGSDEEPPEKLDAAIIFAPVGDLVVQALKCSRRGAVIVCGGIHMSDIPAFPYHLLWNERRIQSVANLTREDAEEFLALAPVIPVKTSTIEYPLIRAAEALDDLSHGRFSGAAVLLI